MCTTCSECVANVYVGVKTHLSNIHTRPCTSAHITCKHLRVTCWGLARAPNKSAKE